MQNKTYHIITIGCQMNKSDSERIAGFLEKLGYKEIDDRYQADLVVVNTCGVRQSAEDKAYGVVNRIKKQNFKTKIILTGCLSERKDVKRRLKEKVDVFLPIVEITNLKSQITNPATSLRDNGAGKFQISNNKSQACEYLNLKPKYSSCVSAFVPIGNGCNNFCSYCVVPYARGMEKYRPAEDIIKEAEALVKDGYKEIYLIAQNVNSYKYNANTANDMRIPRIANNANKYFNFVDLLKIINDIHGNFWIRFSTSHPKDMSDELIKVIAECDKVCKHIHLPVQAGDNKILLAMNRDYTVGHYKKLIKKIRRATPDASITTDAIVGFPGETREQFNNTVELFKEMKFDMAYISQYSPRPGTAAESLNDNVSKLEKKRRAEKLMEILRKTAWENNKKYIGNVVEVLVEGKNKKGEWYGKTMTSKVVKFEIRNLKFEIDKNLAGEFMNVKIINVRGFGLEGEIA